MVEKKVIPTDLKAARQVAERFLERVKATGCGANVLFAVRLAMEEALANAVKHGNKFDRKKKITVSAQVDPESTAITVADEGDGFDPDHLPDPTADENLERPCGRGIMLMRAYMDDVIFNKRGNQVRMVKRTPKPTPTQGRPAGTGRTGGAGD